MRIVIDTSSLIALVRYYLPFDVGNNLYELIKKKIQNGEIIVLDAVLSECEFQSSGLVLKKLDFLNDKDFKKQYKIPLKTVDLLPPAPAKFIRQVESQFTIGVMKNKLEDFEFELEKERWLKSADAKLIIYCLNHIHERTLIFEDIFIVTEESRSQNDSKVFQKIPSICDMLNINVLTLPEMIDKFNDEINIDFIKNG
ncbi:MAG: DUF4411 family protein [Flavobacteriales bacterium]